jgi:hypothetical protein
MWRCRRGRITRGADLGRGEALAGQGGAARDTPPCSRGPRAAWRRPHQGASLRGCDRWPLARSTHARLIPSHFIRGVRLNAGASVGRAST